jgi:uroporphyrinogen III methyltransferase/synthase
VARASEARDVLPDALRERGIAVDVLNLYETLAEPIPTRTLELARSADYVTFTSSSTVRFFLDALGTAPGAQGAAELGDAALSPATRIVSIGPVTSAALRERGLEPHVEAAMHDVDGVIDALLGDAAAQTSKAHAR